MCNEITEIIYNIKQKKQVFRKRNKAKSELQLDSFQRKEKAELEMREEYLREKSIQAQKEYEGWKKMKEKVEGT